MARSFTVGLDDGAGEAVAIFQAHLIGFAAAARKHKFGKKDNLSKTDDLVKKDGFTKIDVLAKRHHGAAKIALRRTIFLLFTFR